MVGVNGGIKKVNSRQGLERSETLRPDSRGLHCLCLDSLEPGRELLSSVMLSDSYLSLGRLSPRPRLTLARPWAFAVLLKESERYVAALLGIEAWCPGPFPPWAPAELFWC